MGTPKQPGHDAEAHRMVALKTLEQSREITRLRAELEEAKRRTVAAEEREREYRANYDSACIGQAQADRDRMEAYDERDALQAKLAAAEAALEEANKKAERTDDYARTCMASLTEWKEKHDAMLLERGDALSKLAAAEAKIERLTARGIEDLKHSLAEAEAERDEARRELAQLRGTLTIVNQQSAKSDEARDAHKARADEAEALLRLARPFISLLRPLRDRIDAHLAASPSPAANSCGADQSLADPPTLTAADARRNVLEPSRRPDMGFEVRQMGSKDAVVVQANRLCPACSGSGVIEQGPVDGRCQRCSGTGLDAQPAQGGDDA